MHPSDEVGPFSKWIISSPPDGWQYVRQQRVAAMEYNVAYHCHCSVRLDSGRTITLDKLTQSRAYAGLLEGTPNKASNDRAIQWALERATRD
ncbi:MAG: hypothetical protein KDA62_23540, partial [Planctomycetales bacterium]|nr:hypothetical protein [Planctomycetales bacterium]